MKIPLSKLETVRGNPGELQRIADARPGGGPNPRWALELAIAKYHASNENSQLARNYLDETISRHARRIRNASVVLDQFDRYVESFCALNHVVADHHRNSKVVVGQLELTLRVTRLDLVPPNGYAAFLIATKQSDMENWSNQLRMPLLQWHIANELSASSDLVTVGLYCLETFEHDSKSFTGPDIEVALQEVMDLAQSGH